jgi:hypothetical protein
MARRKRILGVDYHIEDRSGWSRFETMTVTRPLHGATELDWDLLTEALKVIYRHGSLGHGAGGEFGSVRTIENDGRDGYAYHRSSVRVFPERSVALKESGSQALINQFFAMNYLSGQFHGVGGNVQIPAHTGLVTIGDRVMVFMTDGGETVRSVGGMLPQLYDRQGVLNFMGQFEEHVEGAVAELPPFARRLCDGVQAANILLKPSFDVPTPSEAPISLVGQCDGVTSAGLVAVRRLVHL